MLVIARYMGVMPDGGIQSVIVNERWELTVTGMEVVTKPPPLRLRACQYATPYRFTIRVVDSTDGSERKVGLFNRHPNDVDDEANVLILKHHGHKLTVFVVRLRGNVVRLGFEGKETIFTIRRNEQPL